MPYSMNFYIATKSHDREGSFEVFDKVFSTKKEALQQIAATPDTLCGGTNKGWFTISVYGSGNNPEGADKSVFSVFRDTTNGIFADYCRYGAGVTTYGAKFRSLTALLKHRPKNK